MGHNSFRRVLRRDIAKPKTGVAGEQPQIRMGWPASHPRPWGGHAITPDPDLGWLVDLGWLCATQWPGVGCMATLDPDLGWLASHPMTWVGRATTSDGLGWPLGLGVVVRHPRRLPDLFPSLSAISLSLALSLLAESLSLSLCAGVADATPCGRQRRFSIRRRQVVIQMYVSEIIQCFAHIYFSCNFLSIIICQTLNGLLKTLVLCNDYIEDALYRVIWHLYNNLSRNSIFILQVTTIIQCYFHGSLN
jgi:hypothetical protein